MLDQLFSTNITMLIVYETGIHQGSEASPPISGNRCSYRRVVACIKWELLVTASQHGPSVRGDTHAPMAERAPPPTRALRGANLSTLGLSSDCRLQPACMRVGGARPREGAHHGQDVPGSCTHRPSHHESRQPLKPHALLPSVSHRDEHTAAMDGCCPHHAQGSLTCSLHRSTNSLTPPREPSEETIDLNKKK